MLILVKVVWLPTLASGFPIVHPHHLVHPATSNAQMCSEGQFDEDEDEEAVSKCRSDMLMCYALVMPCFAMLCLSALGWR